MINLRAKDEMGTNVAMIAALVALAGTLAFILFVPPPSAAGISKQEIEQKGRILDDIGVSKKTLAASQAKVSARTWKGGAQQVGPGALQAMTTLAKSHSVKLSGFRPQRTTLVSGLELLPYTVVAEGSFVNVLRFVKAIEDPNTKLAVTLAQLNSADANSDQVTATIGITAYRVNEETKEAKRA